MKKTNVILGTITGLLIATIVGVVGFVGFVSYANNKVDKISTDVLTTKDLCNLDGVMDKADDLYKFNAILSDDVKDRYNKAKEKERLYEVGEQISELRSTITDNIDMLSKNMNMYKYKDAYNNIKSVLSNCTELDNLIGVHNGILFDYPEFGEGLFEHGAILADSTDMFNLEDVWDSYVQILSDTWYYKNCLNASDVGTSHLDNPNVTRSFTGLIGICKTYNMTECYTVDEYMQENYRYFYNLNKTYEIIDEMNATNALKSILDSVVNSDIFDIFFDKWHGEISTNIANDVNDKYRYKLKTSDNIFMQQAHLWVGMNEDGKYVLDKNEYRNAVINELEREFANEMDLGDGFGICFGRISYKNNGGFIISYADPIAISVDDIQNNNINYTTSYYNHN